MLLAIIFITSIAQIILALFVYQKGRRNLTNILFSLLTFATLVWALSNFATISALDSPNLIYIVRFILFCVVIQNAFFYLFAHTFPSTRWLYSKRHLILYALFTACAAAITLSPYLFTDVVIKDGLPSTTAGPAILVFIAHACFSIILAFRTLFQKDHISVGVQKNQLRLLLLASLLNWIVVPVTNFAITPILKTTFFISISPLYTLAFTSIIAYAIVAQKLFDIKLIVARSVAYVLSLGLLATLYATISSLIVDRLFSDFSNQLLTVAINAAIFLIAVLLYPHIKSFFDRATNRFFYRDAYDPQEFLDQLNKSIVSNIEIGILLRHTSSIIEENLKCSYCEIVIPQTDTTPLRVVSTKKLEYSNHELLYLRGRLIGLAKKIVKSEDLLPDDDELRKIFNRHDIAVMVHLSATSYGQNQTIAYMIFGNKKSGNVYSKQDFRIIDIIADELVIAIQNALRFEEIQDFNVTLQNRVNTATHKLQRTNEKLKILDETKDEFISMASHQLRTPLTSVKGYLSMVLEGDAGNINDTQRKLLDQAFVSSQRMVYLIADLLNVSRLRTGKFVIDAHATNLANLVETELSQLKEQAKFKNLTLIYKMPTNFPSLMLDETKTRQVVMNFVDNAMHYTPKGGKINIELSSDKNHVYFMVKDNGLGVPKDEQKHLFTKFYRAKNARNMRPDGTGLGLFMAKKVITGQGGTMLFQSQEGKGSTFGFSFNKKQLAVPENKSNS